MVRKFWKGLGAIDAINDAINDAAMIRPAVEYKYGVQMLMIRLARFGKKKKPFYRIVVIEKERARGGPALEVVGNCDPLTDPPTVNLKHDRVEYWIKNGAQMSDRVKLILEKNPAVQPVA